MATRKNKKDKKARARGAAPKRSRKDRKAAYDRRRPNRRAAGKPAAVSEASEPFDWSARIATVAQDLGACLADTIGHTPPEGQRATAGGIVTVAARARRAREVAGLSVGQARRMTDRNVAAIESGRHCPNGLEIYDLALTYGVSAQWLEHGTPQHVPEDVRARLRHLESTSDAARIVELLEMGREPDKEAL